MLSGFVILSTLNFTLPEYNETACRTKTEIQCHLVKSQNAETTFYNLLCTFALALPE